jgi:hypothetical protein
MQRNLIAGASAVMVRAAPGGEAISTARKQSLLYNPR